MRVQNIFLEWLPLSEEIIGEHHPICLGILVMLNITNKSRQMFVRYRLTAYHGVETWVFKIILLRVRKVWTTDSEYMAKR